MVWGITVICDLLPNTNRAFYESYKYTIHAEKSCIMSINTQYKKKLSVCKMVVVRIINGNPIVCDCCIMCSELLAKYKIKRL